ncbi:PREDICTED: uncharacterized protein LOC104808713 isoform X2 [Tarenaya hassleriana]|nr:PREDICTED: uncharacterized protein LOC104808713 isoform X2 [Tarenaya hassleriana]XP_010532786.1 PREDICTED: uncharacterized protein LOC104808713 isoform X2 [Tarenaya hassleriana]
MPCQEIQSWTFKGLMAAYVDLAVAYLLLCASSLVYLSSKFLGLFGLSLPCPCDGLFSDPSENKCFQEVLGNQPVRKISSVQWSVKGKIPFDSAVSLEQNHGHTIKGRGKEFRDNSLDREACGKGFGDVDGEEDGSWNENVSGLDLLSKQSLKKGSYRMKGKGYTVNRSPCGLRYRRKVSFGPKKFPQSSGSVGESVKDIEERDSPTVISEECGKALKNNFLSKSLSLASGGFETGAQGKQPERTSSWAGDGDDQKRVRILEQALEEERAAHAALSLELEKERNAAATAADEAMAMILRLQEEKASIVMEARQNQRMIEEKCAFDAEEMSILKEILLRREKEKHFLEKEVESYRQMLLDIEETKPDAKADPVEVSFLSDLTENVVQTPGPTTISFVEKGNLETEDLFSRPGVISNPTENSFLGLGNESMAPRFDFDANSSKMGEVHRVLFDNTGDETLVHNQSSNVELHVHGKTETWIDEEQQKREQDNAFPGPMSKASEENIGEDSYDVDCHVHDVHVITDEDKMTETIQGKGNVPSAYTEARDFKLDRSRSVSDTTYKLPPLCPPPRRQNMSPDMRRKSMSAVDYERLKIENEVGWLWGRLKAIQQGREKLHHSIVVPRERGKTQLQLLEDITRKLHNINEPSETGKSFHRDSLLHPSSMVKVMSKKRPCRSASLDQHSA